MASNSEQLTSRFVSRLTNETVAVVLAGGRGSRLEMLTDWRAKPSVPFGGKFRIIDFPLSNCINSGIRKICVLTQYKSHSLMRHIMRGWNMLNVETGDCIELIPAQQWVQEDSWFEGTADAVYQSLDIIESHSPKLVLVLAGDHVYQMDYGEILAAHAKNNADITVSCIPVTLNEAKSFGVMSVDDESKIIEFNEKPEHPKPLAEDPDYALASMGVYVFTYEYLQEQLQRDAKLESSKHDFGMDLIPHAVKNNHRIFAYSFSDQVAGKNAYWRDIGTIDSYFKSHMEVLTYPPALDLYNINWRIFTYQEQLPPAKFIGFENNGNGIMENSMVSGGCLVLQSDIKKSLLFSNVMVDKNCDLQEVLALPGVSIGENSRMCKVVIDNGCKIPPGTVIGENQEEDSKRFHVTPEGVVFVNREMLGQGRRYLPSSATEIQHTKESL